MRPALAVGELAQLGVARAVAARQLGGVNGVVTVINERGCQSLRELRVDEELHAEASGTARRIVAASAPNSMAASTSSRSRSA